MPQNDVADQPCATCDSSCRTMLSAARLPSATAFTTSLPPDVQSPPAQIRGWLVRPYSSTRTTPSVCRTSFGAARISAPRCPVARTTTSTCRVRCPRRRRRRVADLQALDPIVPQDPPRLRVEQDPHPVLPRQLHLVRVGRHLLRAAPVQQPHLCGPRPRRLRGHVDRRVPAADDRHPRPADRPRHPARLPAQLQIRDEAQRVAHPGQLLAGQPQRRDLCHADPQEQRVVPPRSSSIDTSLPTRTPHRIITPERTSHSTSRRAVGGVILYCATP